MADSVSPWQTDDERTVRTFTETAGRFGFDARALQWGSALSQRLRFAALAGIGNLNQASVLDVGCGLGDFALWLQEHRVTSDYTGIDITPRMIQMARLRAPALKFEVANLLDPSCCFEDSSFDYVVASGIFFLRQQEPMAYLLTMVSKMFQLCRMGVAFNSLSQWGDQKEAGEFYADPLEVLATCRRLTDSLVLRHDYHPGDFTIYLYGKNRP